MKLYYTCRNACHTNGPDFTYSPVEIHCDVPAARLKKFIHDFANNNLTNHDAWGNQGFVFMFYSPSPDDYNPIHALIGFTDSQRPVYTFLD